MWTCQLASNELIEIEHNQSCLKCHYIINNKLKSHLSFSCEALLGETKDTIFVTPAFSNGELIQLDYNELRSSVDSLNTKMKKDEKLKRFILTPYRKTISVLFKQERLFQQIVKQSKPCQASVCKIFEKLFVCLEVLLPEIQIYMKFCGIKYSSLKTHRSLRSQQDFSEKSATATSTAFSVNHLDEKFSERALQKVSNQIFEAEQQMQRKMKKLMEDDFAENLFHQCKKKEMIDETKQKQWLNFKDEQKMLGEITELMNSRKTAEFDSDSNIIMCKSIEEDSSAFNCKSVGGVSEVEKVKAKKITLMAKSRKGKNIVEYNKTLAKKKSKVEKYALRSDGKEELNNDFVRFTREKEIIEKINKNGGKKPYLLNYYFTEDESSFYIDWVDKSLLNFLSIEREYLEINSLLDICSQIVMIVIDLHESGVVHRDLKPSNFMIVQEKGHRKVKLIDFSDSFIIDSEPLEIKIYATVPYSPIQCSRNHKSHSKIGLNKMEIDYWSVGVLLHEIFFGFAPTSFSSSLSRDIYNLWENQFLSCVNLRKRRGVKLMETVFQFLKVNLVQPKQSLRIRLEKVLLILLSAQVYCKKIRQICLERNQNNYSSQAN